MTIRPLQEIGTGEPSGLAPVHNLHVLVCLFNPVGSQRIVRNYRTFRRMLGNLPITVVELVFDRDQIIEPHAIHIRGTRERHSLWQKERLLNIGLGSLPDSVDAVAWLDADIVLPETWYTEAVSALRNYMVIQPFMLAHWLDEKWRIQKTFMSCAMRKLHPKTRMFAHPGFAWVARREVLSGGFFDLDLTGNGDIWLACAFDRSQDRLYARSASSFMHEAWKEWAFPVSELVDGNLGVIESELVHLNHGPYVNRRYSERGNWMFESGLCRDQVILDDNGLYTVVGNTRFRDIMRDYFSSRQDG